MSVEPPLVSIVVPVLDERVGTEWLLGSAGAWKAPWPWELIFVDGGSSDGTRALFESLPEALRAIYMEPGHGLAGAWKAGLKAARGQIRVTMDGDGVHALDSIPELVARIERGSDLVIANRYGPGGSGMPRRSWSDRLASRIAALSWSRRYAPGVMDPLHGFRARSQRLYETVAPRLQAVDGNVFMGWETAWAKDAGLRVTEVPLRYGRRVGGKDKKSLVREGVRLVRAVSLPGHQSPAVATR
jgi:dolichol-phosphate mannosyltransferase